MDEKKVIDVDFTEDSQETSSINGKPLYFSTSQVAQMLNLSDSAVRFYCTKFKDIIKPEMSGSHRKFSESDIEKLRYIKKLLKEDGLSMNQVLEYASEKDVKAIEKKIEKQEPLAMQALATAVAIEVGAQLEDYKLMIKEELLNEMKTQFKNQEDLIRQQEELQENRTEELKDFIAVSVREGVQEELKELKGKIDEREFDANERLKQISDKFSASLEEQKKLNEQKNRGLWSKLFGK
jgi:DNA-binding transcriptional MerR regulator